MSDDEIRELERLWRASGAPADKERWVRARARAGLEPADPEARVKLEGKHPFALSDRAVWGLVDPLLQELGEEPLGDVEPATRHWETRDEEHDEEKRSRPGFTVTIVASADLAIPIMESRDYRTTGAIEWTDPPRTLRLPWLNLHRSCPYEIEGPAAWAARVERAWLAVTKRRDEA